MAVQHMRVAAAGAVLALSAAGYAEDVDQANPDTKALLEYVKKLESRVNQLESERDWPIERVRGASESALESAVKSVNLSGYMEFQYGFNLRHGGTHESPFRNDTLAYSPLRGSANDDNGFSFQNLQLLADKPLAAMNSTGFRVRAEFGEVSRFDNRDGNFTDTAHAFDVREAYMSWRMDPRWGMTNYVDLSLGKFDSPLGLETPDANDPANLGLVTRNPIHVLATPVTHTGLRAVFPWQECSKTTVYIVNGWDNVRDAADGKTVIVSHEMGKFDWLNSTVTINGSYGNEGGGISHTPGDIAPDGNKVKLLEAIWHGELDNDNQVALDAVWARSDHAGTDSSGNPRSVNTHAVSGYFRHQWTKDMWVSARLGYFSSGTQGAAPDFRVADASLALGWDLAEDLTMAVEYRHDRGLSGNAVFFSTSGKEAENQDTVTASFVYRF